MLTIVIPCKNERLNLRPCVESASLLGGEILVADSGSTDETRDIARSLGCRVIEREYVHYGDFNNWAIRHAAHEWVFVLDADERITPGLAEEIRELFRTGPRHDGYRVRRKNFFLGRRIRRGSWGTDRPLRLFRRNLGRYVGDTDHATVRVETERVGMLRGRMEHFTFRSYDQYFVKFDRYTRLQAKVWYEQGRRPSVAKLLFNGPLRFLRDYFLEFGFLDGVAGFQVCMIQAFYSFMKQARLWELHYAAPVSDPEAASRREAPVAARRSRAA